MSERTKGSAARRSDELTIWDRFDRIADLLYEAKFVGAGPEVLLQDIQEEIDLIHARLAVLDV